MKADANQYSYRDKDDEIKSFNKHEEPIYKRTNTGNMYEDLIKDLNSNESVTRNKFEFDFISEDNEEDNHGDDSKNFIQKFEFQLTDHEKQKFLNRNKDQDKVDKVLPIVIIEDSDNSDE